MKKKLLLLAVLSAISLVSCKKETTTPSNSTTTTTSNTLNYGQYTGTGTVTTDTKYYDSQGNLIQGLSSLATTPDLGIGSLSKDGNGNTLLTGGGFISSPIKIIGTNYTVDEYEYSKTVSGNNSSQIATISGSGTINGKDVTMKSIYTLKTKGSDGSSSIMVKTTTASYHFYM